MIIASFCIPTYNRGLKVYNTIQNILRNCTNINFEICVLDNLSNDNTTELLTSITDNRFRYYINKERIIGPLNIIKSLSYANGKYAFLCLDKDFVDPNYINCLIDRLNTIPDIAFGYCALNLNQVFEDSYYSKGFDSLYNMSYLSAHPTGMFYNTDLYKKNNFYSRISDKSVIFGFYPDVINAEMAISGSSAIIKLPIFQTESISECEKIKSYTFKNEENLFFTPSNRFKHFIFYIEHLLSFNISKVEKITIIKKLYRKEIIASTIEYRSILGNSSICSHYYINTRKVKIIEIVKIYIIFTINFLSNKSTLNVIDKIRICLSQSIMLFSEFVKINCLKISHKLYKIGE